jgi:hypothetical protein
MTIARRLTTSLVLLLASMTPALAQEPAKLIDPHDKNAVRPGPGIELGFYDPATGVFTRGMPPASTSGSLFSGNLSLLGLFDIDTAINHLLTIFVYAYCDFGPLITGQFAPNLFAEASVNFAAGEPQISVSIPFAYTSAGNSARMSVRFSAQVTDNNNVTHSAGVSLPLEPVPNGNVTRKFRITM